MNTIFWDVTPCIPLNANRRFSLYFRAGVFLGLFFGPESAGCMFLRNVGCRLRPPTLVLCLVEIFRTWSRTEGVHCKRTVQSDQRVAGCPTADSPPSCNLIHWLVSSSDLASTQGLTNVHANKNAGELPCNRRHPRIGDWLICFLSPFLSFLFLLFFLLQFRDSEPLWPVSVYNWLMTPRILRAVLVLDLWLSQRWLEC
jgi:hypothetical protein